MSPSWAKKGETIERGVSGTSISSRDLVVPKPFKNPSVCYYIEGFKQTSWKAHNFLTTPTYLLVSNQNPGVSFLKLSSKLRGYRAEVGYRESVIFSLEKRLETCPNSEKMEGQKFGSFYWQGFSVVVVLLWSEVLGAIQNREKCLVCTWGRVETTGSLEMASCEVSHPILGS